MIKQNLFSALIKKEKIICPLKLTAIAFILFFAGFTNIYAEEKKDTRILVKLPSDIQDKMIAIMRDHIRALEDIIYAIQVEDYDKAEDIVESRLGWSSSLGLGGQEVVKHWPEPMQKMAEQLYHAANNYVVISQNTAVKDNNKNDQKVIAALGEVVTACRTCHEAYRLR